MVRRERHDPYWSRTGETCELAPREDPVVWGDGGGPLDAAALERYAERGCHFEPSLFSPGEVARLREEVDRLASEADPEREDVIVEPGGDAIRSIFRVHRDGALCASLVRDGRLAGVARQLLGDEVEVHQSRVNFKPGFDGKEFYWHSDFETWHVEDGMPRMRAVSVSINLDPGHPLNGPLMVIPGSHRVYVRCVGETPEDHFRESLRRQAIGVPDHDSIRRLAEDGGIEAPVGPAGSALFFECNLLHGSAGNLTPLPRTNLFFVLNAVSNRLVAPFGGRPPRPAFLAERPE